MGYTFAALRGRMGSTDYYQASVKARELAAVAIMAAELPQWTSWSVFERFQRELAQKRVEKEIVPYLVRTKDRFFNSLIVLVFGPEVFEFESLAETVPGLPRAYKGVAEQMGFLTIEGGNLVVLDGQHRLAALRGVTTAGPEVTGDFVDAVAEDELSVLFIPHESFEKTRRIFNKVNRYAKPTSPTDNIITSEDDGSAIVTRWLVEDEPPLGLAEPRPPLNASDGYGEPIVEWRQQTLRPDAQKFTTLSALYQMTQSILSADGITGFDEKHMVNRPTDRQLARAYTFVARWWHTVLTNFTPYRRSLKRPSLIPDFREYRAEYSLLFRPIGQIAFMNALVGAAQLGRDLEDSLETVEDNGWSASDSLFIDTVVYANGRMATSEHAIRLAGRLGTYLLAWDLMSPKEIDRLEADLREAKGDPDFVLP
ncbi:DGQHR domain-containing protein [Mycolicibacterium elephantis]|uniref:DGQHR domain-containing protein n=1 Tax=Mycolicibacterium elephantis TaxID=81858 RepID=UPI0009ED4BE3|nr:DNA sulfur modification protein DndB [Mycolicibacterium elephantis]